MPTSMHKLFWGAGRKAWQSFRLLRTGCLPRTNACQLLTTCTGQWQHSLRSCDGFIAKLQQSYSGGRTTPEASLAVPGNGGWWYPPFDKPSSRTVVVGTAPLFTNLPHGPWCWNHPLFYKPSSRTRCFKRLSLICLPASCMRSSEVCRRGLSQNVASTRVLLQGGSVESKPSMQGSVAAGPEAMFHAEILGPNP